MEQFIFTGLLIAIVLIIGAGLLTDIILLKMACKRSEQRLQDFMLVDYYKLKYPLVTEDFLIKNQEQQLIENNQEIHELNKRVTELEDNITGAIDKLDVIINKLNNPNPLK